MPYSVLNGKLPIAMPQAGKQQRRRKAKGSALQLCAHFERTGQCPDLNCRFAHGKEELEKRLAQAKYALNFIMPMLKPCQHSHILLACCHCTWHGMLCRSTCFEKMR